MDVYPLIMCVRVKEMRMWNYVSYFTNSESNTRSIDVVKMKVHIY